MPYLGYTRIELTLLGPVERLFGDELVLFGVVIERGPYNSKDARVLQAIVVSCLKKK